MNSTASKRGSVGAATTKAVSSGHCWRADIGSIIRHGRRAGAAPRNHRREEVAPAKVFAPRVLFGAA